jgi:2-phosphoglycerate kinase
MKKEELIAKLTGVKEYTNTVSIDFVLAALGMLEEPTTKAGLTQELAEEIANRIERTLDYNASDLVDKDDVTFNITYGNVIEVDDASINVSETMDHIAACLDEFIVEEDDECGPSENNVMQSINEGLGL